MREGAGGTGEAVHRADACIPRHTPIASPRHQPLARLLRDREKCRQWSIVVSSSPTTTQTTGVHDEQLRQWGPNAVASHKAADVRLGHHAWIREHGTDLPEVSEWNWNS
ncbi:hypothetical protein ACFYXH_23700 [Streptomyces sp. NPDC002730]|uniref:hypothetical protein n=1 Tax=Streptomyces sp. NPDC002730 TaxID=3364662 RepID=UPI00368CD1F7